MVSMEPAESKSLRPAITLPQSAERNEKSRGPDSLLLFYAKAPSGCAAGVGGQNVQGHCKTCSSPFYDKQPFSPLVLRQSSPAGRHGIGHFSRPDRKTTVLHCMRWRGKGYRGFSPAANGMAGKRKVSMPFCIVGGMDFSRTGTEKIFPNTEGMDKFPVGG